MAEEYIKRSTRFAKCEMREIHPLRFDPWTKHPAAAKILLDPLAVRSIQRGSLRWSRKPSAMGATWSF